MSDTSFSLPSFAKINLHLEVLGKRSDGYHELCTVFQAISLHDSVSFAASDQITLTCDDDRIPLGEENLIIRAAQALKAAFPVDAGASMHLQKRIPVGGGLGGGSSNAAVALIGLTRLWNIKAGTNELLEIAGTLGSDVPFFLYGGTAVGTRRGTEIVSIADVTEKFVLLVAPDTAVSTREAFAALNAPSLTTHPAKSILNNCRFDAESLDLRSTALRNDFESTVFASHPEIGSVKQTLLDLGAANALMSGSGASVFAVFDKEETRQTAMKALDTQVNWRKFAVATILRRKYREALEF